MDPHCRIVRVRMKAGGADVRVLKGGGLSKRATLLLDYARQMVKLRGDNFGGFMILAWGKDAGCAVGGDVSSMDSPIPFNLLPHYVSEVVRRAFVTGSEVRNIIDTEYVTPNSRPPRGA